MQVHKTPLYKVAREAGATFGEFWGWTLPRMYADVVSEYEAAKGKVGIHDSSYTGRVKATGQDVLDLLNRLSTNEVDSLQLGQGALTILTNDKGRIIDLITVYHMGEYILLFTSPAATEQVGQWIDKYTIVEDVVLEDLTHNTAMLSLLGPEAASFLGDVLRLDLSTMQDCSFKKVEVAGSEVSLIRRDALGLPELHLLLQQEEVEKVWGVLVSNGAVPIGMDAYDALRVEAGRPDYGKELGELYNPLEAGLTGAVSFTKGCYIGQEVIARLDTYDKVQKHLVALTFSGEELVKEGMALCRQGREVGTVTSVVKVPTTGRLVGMGYLRKAVAQAGSKLSLGDGVTGEAEVEKLVQPFGPGVE